MENLNVGRYNEVDNNRAEYFNNVIYPEVKQARDERYEDYQRHND